MLLLVMLLFSFYCVVMFVLLAVFFDFFCLCGWCVVVASCSCKLLLFCWGCFVCLLFLFSCWRVVGVVSICFCMSVNVLLWLSMAFPFYGCCYSFWRCCFFLFFLFCCCFLFVCFVHAVGLLLLLVRVCCCCFAGVVSLCFGLACSCISAVFLLVLCCCCCFVFLFAAVALFCLLCFVCLVMCCLFLIGAIFVVFSWCWRVGVAVVVNRLLC